MSDPRAAPLTSRAVGFVAISTLVAGFDWPGPGPRTHLVLVTLEGRGRLRVAGEERDLLPGSVAVCPAGVPRRHWAEDHWRLVTVRVGDVEQWDRLTETGPFVIAGEDPQRFAAPVQGILAELPAVLTAVSGASRGRSPMDEILSRFSTQIGLEGAPGAATVATDPFSLHASALGMQLDRLLEGPPSTDREEIQLRGLWEAVRRDPGARWSVESLAGQLNVSRATLHRMVARHFDQSPGVLVERIRMDHAAHLLAHGGIPIKAIAAQVGYSTPYSFSAAFRRVVGTPPSAFRAQVAAVVRP
jgi:AraC-like DNA-binding protein